MEKTSQAPLTDEEFRLIYLFCIECEGIKSLTQLQKQYPTKFKALTNDILTSELLIQTIGYTLEKPEVLQLLLTKCPNAGRKINWTAKQRVIIFLENTEITIEPDQDLRNILIIHTPRVRAQLILMALEIEDQLFLNRARISIPMTGPLLDAILKLINETFPDSKADMLSKLKDWLSLDWEWVLYAKLSDPNSDITEEDYHTIYGYTRSDSAHNTDLYDRLKDKLKKMITQETSPPEQTFYEMVRCQKNRVLSTSKIQYTQICDTSKAIQAISDILSTQPSYDISNIVIAIRRSSLEALTAPLGTGCDKVLSTAMTKHPAKINLESMIFMLRHGLLYKLQKTIEKLQQLDPGLFNAALQIILEKKPEVVIYNIGLHPDYDKTNKILDQLLCTKGPVHWTTSETHFFRLNDTEALLIQPGIDLRPVVLINTRNPRIKAHIIAHTIARDPSKLPELWTWVKCPAEEIDTAVCREIASILKKPTCTYLSLDTAKVYVTLFPLNQKLEFMAFLKQKGIPLNIDSDLYCLLLQSLCTGPNLTLPQITAMPSIPEDMKRTLIETKVLENEATIDSLSNTLSLPHSNKPMRRVNSHTCEFAFRIIETNSALIKRTHRVVGTIETETETMTIAHQLTSLWVLGANQHNILGYLKHTQAPLVHKDSVNTAMFLLSYCKKDLQSDLTDYLVSSSSMPLDSLLTCASKLYELDNPEIAGSLIRAIIKMHHNQTWTTACMLYKKPHQELNLTPPFEFTSESYQAARVRTLEQLATTPSTWESDLTVKAAKKMVPKKVRPGLIKTFHEIELLLLVQRESSLPSELLEAVNLTELEMLASRWKIETAPISKAKEEEVAKRAAEAAAKRAAKAAAKKTKATDAKAKSVATETENHPPDSKKASAVHTKENSQLPPRPGPNTGATEATKAVKKALKTGKDTAEKETPQTSAKATEAPDEPIKPNPTPDFKGLAWPETESDWETVGQRNKEKPSSLGLGQPKRANHNHKKKKAAGATKPVNSVKQPTNTSKEKRAKSQKRANRNSKTAPKRQATTPLKKGGPAATADNTNPTTPKVPPRDHKTFPELPGKKVQPETARVAEKGGETEPETKPEIEEKYMDLHISVTIPGIPPFTSVRTLLTHADSDDCQAATKKAIWKRVREAIAAVPK